MTATALPRLAEVEDLRKWPEVTVGDDQTDAAEAVLSRASARVRRQAGKTWLNDDGSALADDIPDGITSLVVQISARFWNNPNGATLITKGPFTEQFAQAVEAGVYLTQGEKDEISDIVSEAGTRPRLWTLSTTRLDSDDTGVWVTDEFGGDPILYGGYLGQPRY